MAAMDNMIREWTPPYNTVETEESRAEAFQAVLDMAMQDAPYISIVHPDIAHQLPGVLEAHELSRMADKLRKPRGIKALIPVPEPETFGKMMGRHAKATLEAIEKPKRKRRTKTEMEEAKAGGPKSKSEARKLFLEEAGKLTPEMRAKFKAEDERNKPPDQVGVLRLMVREVIKPNWMKAIAADGYKTFTVKAIRNNQPLSLYPTNWAEALKAEGLNVSFDGQAPKITFRPLNISQNGDSSQDGKQELWIEVKIA